MQTYRMNFETGQLQPISTEGKNDLPRGTVLHLHGYNEPEYVITSKIDVDRKYGYGAIYETVNLATYEQGCHRMATLYWPSEHFRGIHTEITNRVMSEDEVQTIESRVDEAKKTREEKARQEAETKEQRREEYRNKYTYLESYPASKKSGRLLCSSNIRIELKRAFPGTKFSVKSSNDGMHVIWTDGPTKKQVRAITGKYHKGNFNGIEDIYEIDYSNVWPDVFGGTRYVFEDRRYAEETFVLLVKELCRLNDIEYSEPYYSIKVSAWSDSPTTIARRIFNDCEIPAGHRIIGLERTDVTCGRHEEFYRIVTEG